MKICVQTGNVINEFGFEKGYRLLRESGFEAVDWNIDQAYPQKDLFAGKLSGCIFERPLSEILDHYRVEMDCILQSGLEISQAHAPFPAHAPGVPGAEEYSIRLYQNCIRLCQVAGCKNLIIHGISCSPLEPELSAEEVERKNFHLYESLLPALEGTKVTVCLENLFVGLPGGNCEGVCSNPYEAARYIDTLNQKAGAEHFGLCLDTGHLNLLHKNMREYMRVVGRRIKALHIHDNNGIDDQHLMPFTGTVRWNDFTATLRELGYQGDLSFETFNQTDRSRMDLEYIPVFLRAIAGIGEVFRQQIQG